MLKHLPILDAGSPVNDAHPLNDGLVSWWMVSPFGHPSFRGGDYLWDLCGKNRGSLTNGPKWQGAMGRPGGFGSLFFDGTDDSVEVAISRTPYASMYSFSCWVRFDGTTADTFLAPGSNFAYARADVDAFRWQQNGGSFPLVASTVTPTTGRWYHYCVTSAGSGAGQTEVYINGLPTGNGTAIPSITTDNISIGNGVLGFFAGNLDAITVHSRALSTSEVAQLYEEQVNGCPNLLNIRSRASWFLNAAAGAAGLITHPNFWAVRA